MFLVSGSFHLHFLRFTSIRCEARIADFSFQQKKLFENREAGGKGVP